MLGLIISVCTADDNQCAIHDQPNVCQADTVSHSACHCLSGWSNRNTSGHEDTIAQLCNRSASAVNDSAINGSKHVQFTAQCSATNFV